MRKAEQRLWDTMKRQRDVVLKIPSADLMWNRVENNVGAGMPDLFMKSAFSTDCWVELKAPACPKRTATKLFREHATLSVDQINWALNYTRNGGRWYVIARDSEKELYMFNYRWIRTLDQMTISEARKATLACTWQGIFQILLNGKRIT